MLKTDIAEQIEKFAPWFHNLHLPDGSQTAPHLGDFPSCKWLEIAAFIPEDLHGLRALDIGCNAGFYSLELARRGARVTAIDINEHYLKQALWAADTLELIDNIEFRQARIYDLASANDSYDLVLCMGVLNHLRHPLLALDCVRKCCKGHMIFQTMTAPGDYIFPVQADYGLHEREVMNEPGWPKMAFIEHCIANDSTHWWAPNYACIEAMLRSAGFGSIRQIAHETYSCEANLAVPDLVQDELHTIIQSPEKYIDTGKTAM